MTPEEMEGVSRFGRAVDGAYGTVVFGGGASALVGEIAHTGDDDYLVVEGWVSGAFDGPPQTFAVPISSVLYFKWRDDRL